MLTNDDLKDSAELAKFAKDYWQIREEIAYMYKLKRKTNDNKEQLNLNKTIEVLRLMLRKNYSKALNYNFTETNFAIDEERRHRYDDHRNRTIPLKWDEREPHR